MNKGTEPRQEGFQRAILASRRGPESQRLLASIRELLRQCNVACYPDTGSILEQPEQHRDALQEGGLGVVVGGDGTLLMVARILAPFGIPMVGVNTGRLGFLTDVTPDTMQAQLQAVLGGAYREEPRIMLQCRATRRGKLFLEQNAANEVAIQKWNVSRLFSYETRIDGVLLYRQRGDGIMLSTPTGSTAYSLAAGGPLLFPAMEAFVLVPICPHVLSNRPIVLAASHRVEIIPSATDSAHATLTCDGYLAAELLPGDVVEITATTYRMRLIHPLEHTHLDILRTKLGWGK